MSTLSSAKRVVRNPITGEEISYSNEQNANVVPVNETKNFKKNKNLNDKEHNSSPIPILNFDGFINESDRIRQKYESKPNPIINQEQILHSSRPKSAYTHGYDQMPLKSPIMNYQQELKNELTNRQDSTTSQASQLEAPRVVKPVEKKEKINLDRIEDLEKLWSQDGSQEFDTTRKVDNLDKYQPAKEKLVLDTVLTDQLSRFVLSEPEQDFSRNTNIRKLHNTVINTKNSVSENVLNRRIKFSCRLRSQDGRKSLRELFGILFLFDGSLTIYEFRQMSGACFTGIGSGNLSKKANALPFISRKCYRHAFGRRKGNVIDIYDLFKGNILYIPSNSTEQNDTDRRSSDYYEIEVTGIDELEKEKLVTSQIADAKTTDTARNCYKAKENLYSDVEINDLKIIRSIQSFFNDQIKTRSIKVYTGIGRMLNKMSVKTEGYIDLQQFHYALSEYNLQIHEDDLDRVWNVLDLDNTGYLSYYTLLRACLGEMNQLRHSYFRELMHKLDTQKSGYIQLTDVHKFYRAKQHPKVKNGEISEKDYFEQLLSYFVSVQVRDLDQYRASIQSNINSPLISYEQFENYYNGLSLIVQSDSSFLNILKNSWSIL